MNKETFLRELDLQLDKIPKDDRMELIYDFIEHFENGEQEGKSEEEISAELGNPKWIARDMLMEYRLTQAQTDKSVRNISRVILATISLSFFNLILVVGPVAAIVAVYLGLAVSSIALMFIPIVWFVANIGYADSFLQPFFVTLTVSSFGVLFGIGMLYVGKGLYFLILKYVKYNIRIVKGER
ncbi:HAAS signaling domain-containing protein [Radiobacillus deserti]|uniref:DUF1700 domain-containing protein n=1 Tax=Radiobacillus deserti TaxID=2594883 RepID=A0A516KK27_9BACI|nr:DUF1700 domain-containing protein [Radiobacillus deserti]QDP41744.1 DUF1700 domain-containing protein [Radiobacillus deserti]